jgi:hypothetical protein
MRGVDTVGQVDVSYEHNVFAEACMHSIHLGICSLVQYSVGVYNIQFEAAQLIVYV